MELLSQPFLMVTTKKEGAKSFPHQFKDNQLIRIVKVLLSDPYQPGEIPYGQCKYKVVRATTDQGIEFLLWDDEKEIRNARQYGSGNNPASWGQRR